jgi:serine-type D-Ala-D-Ala carboxypeptidase
MRRDAVKISDQVGGVVEQAIRERVFPGATVWIGKHDETIHCAAYGNTADASYNGYSPVSVTLNTLYDLASLTKVIATTSAIMRLVEQGILRLTDTVAMYMSEFGTDRQKASVSIWHLLTHTSGLPGPLPLYKQYQDKENILQAICRQQLLFPPGTQYLYCDIGFILLGEVITLLSSLDMSEYCCQYLFQPLNMMDTLFNPPRDLWHRVAPTEYVEWRGGLVHGCVHDENAWFMGGTAGHAGLFSTIEDMAKFCTMFLNYGKYLEKRIFATSSIVEMTSPHNLNAGEWFGLGWGMNSPWFMGLLASQEMLGHTGFTGTSIMINLQQDLALVLLSNRVCPTRNGPNINPYRRKLANTLVDLVEER